MKKPSYIKKRRKNKLTEEKRKGKEGRRVKTNLLREREEGKGYM